MQVGDDVCDRVEYIIEYPVVPYYIILCLHTSTYAFTVCVGIGWCCARGVRTHATPTST